MLRSILDNIYIWGYTREAVGGSRVAPVGRATSRCTQQIAGTDHTGWYGNNFEV